MNKSSLTKLVILSFGLMLSITSSRAQNIISWNLFGHASGSSVSATTGAVPASNWNNSPSAAVSGGPTALILDNGAASGASVTFDVGGAVFHNGLTPAGNSFQELYDGRGDSAGTTEVSINVSSVPFNVYVYYAINSATAHDFTISVNGGAAVNVQPGTGITGNTSLLTTFVENTDNGATQSNFDVFSGLTDSTMTILTDGTDSTNNRRAIVGFQIVQVPEPGTAAMLVGGMGTLMLFRRRR